MGRFARIVLLLAACWLLVVAATGAANLQQSWLVPSGGIKLSKQYFNDQEHKFVALTFDDGPDQHGYTLKVSDILAQYGVPGTFFLIGERAKAYPNQVEELVARGHEIGIHCYSHRQFTKLSAEQQITDITKCRDLLNGLGAEPQWFRPPYGEFSKSTLNSASKLGLETVLWTNDPRDWSQPGVETIIRRVVRDTTPGGVILLHSTNAQTVAALPAIIDQLAAKGYQFVTMSQWHAALSGQAIQASQAEEGEFFTPYQPEDDLPRVIEEIEAQSPEDHADLLWSSIRSIGQETLASQGMINWVKDNETPVTAEQYTVYTNFATAADIESVPRKGGLRRFSAFVDAPPAAPSASVQASLAPIEPDSVVETPVQEGGELPALPAGEEIIIPPDAPAVEQAATATRPPVVQEYPTAVAPPLVLEIPPLEERQPLPSRVIDLVDMENPATAWQAPASIDASGFDGFNEYLGLEQVEPRFYFLNIVGNLEDYTWNELETFVRLGQLSGMVLANEFTTAPPSVEVSYPWAFHQMRFLDRGAVIDLTVEDTADVISALQRGKQNVFIVVRPANLHFFIAAHLWAEMNYNMQDFVLLRQMTAGLNYDPAANLEEFWQLPDGVHLARFSNGTRTALVLYSKLRQPQVVEIPEQFAYFSQAQIDEGGFLRIEPLAAREVQVSRRPVVLYYEYSQP